jgi:cell division protein FtsB
MADAVMHSIRVLEKGMEQLRLLQAVFHLARARRELNSLKNIRTELQADVRRLIDELSPEYLSPYALARCVCVNVR